MSRRFDAAEIQFIRELYPHLPTRLVAAALDRTNSSVNQMAKKLGLRKSADFFKSPKLSGRLDGQRGADMRFRAGHVPANKGLRRPGWAPGRMAETQFKKGRPASAARNYVPIGTEKIDPKRRVLMRKITDDPTLFPVSRWRPVHVLVWEAANGPVPPGHIVVFRPGKKTFVADEITLDRIELVSLQENMRRNTVHNLPAPLAKLVQLRGMLNRKINRLEERHEKQG